MFTFPTGEAVHNATLRDRLCDAPERAELPAKRLHDLRHGAATIMVTNDVDHKTAAEKLGHADVGLTLRRYVTPSADRRRRAAESLSAILAS